ncbi:MAG: hypothetical protein COB35_04955 [Gammaproteobacteria bacterium]|nr:MAG: hypothetical protein COB35_04955 [Gammaproteobacteria bacterium]
MSVLAVYSIAKTLGLTDWLADKLAGSDSTAAKLASKVMHFAASKTGETDPEKIQAKLAADPALAAALKQTLIDNAHQLDLAPYKDRASARTMYSVHNDQADKIAERIIKYNLFYVLFLVLVQCLLIHFLKDEAAVLAAASATIGAVIKGLLDERKDVTGFYFGSSMGSKQKDANTKQGAN